MDMMTRRKARSAAVGIIALSLAACTGPTQQVVRATSMKRFNASDRRAVWGRAVVSFNAGGMLITSSDSAGGVLRTAMQPGWSKCRPEAVPYVPGESRESAADFCRDERFSQFTISDDGVAFLRSHRLVYCQTAFREPCLSDDNVSAVQKETDDLLRYIVGDIATSPEHESKPTGGSLEEI
jgi:hypothetical protein